MTLHLYTLFFFFSFSICGESQCNPFGKRLIYGNITWRCGVGNIKENMPSRVVDFPSQHQNSMVAMRDFVSFLIYARSWKPMKQGLLHFMVANKNDDNNKIVALRERVLSRPLFGKSIIRVVPWKFIITRNGVDQVVPHSTIHPPLCMTVKLCFRSREWLNKDLSWRFLKCKKN